MSYVYVDAEGKPLDEEPLDVGHTFDEGWGQGIAAERSRIRAILMHLLGKEWTGNQVLEWLDSGKTLEELKK